MLWRAPGLTPTHLPGWADASAIWLQIRSQLQNGPRFDFFKSRQNLNLFKPFDSESHWGQISQVLLLLRRKKSTGAISAWISGRSDLAKTAFFGLQSSINPLVNFISKCVENCQFFIFRKSKPRAPSYFKMSKKTRSEPILSSETWF